jgi:hypothetical protein
LALSAPPAGRTMPSPNWQSRIIVSFGHSGNSMILMLQ